MKLFSKSILITAAAAALVLVLGSCDLFAPKTDPISATETMQGFVSTANAGAYGSLKGYTHSKAGMYNSANSAFWDTEVGTYTPLKNLVVTGNSATATSDSGTVAFSFTLEEDDPDQYKIKTIAKNWTYFFQ